MESGLYFMRYVGQTGAGGGAMFIGRSQIVGADVAGGRYQGSYEEVDGGIRGTITLTMVTDGKLVTGMDAPKGTKLTIEARLGPRFADGTPQQIMVQGHPVEVVFEKVGDIQ